MTDLNLDAIEARANAAMLSPTGQQYDAGVVLSTDVPALVAEVRSLRTHLAHAAEVEAALTSDLLAAHVEVEQLRVTRATDRNRGMTDLDLDFIDPRKATPGQVADIIALCREQAEELARLRESESFLLAESEQNLAETASLAAERDDARAERDAFLAALGAIATLPSASIAVRDIARHALLNGGAA